MKHSRPTHWQLDLEELPRNLNGRRLNLEERIALRNERREREPERERLARLFHTSPRLWK